MLHFQRILSKIFFGFWLRSCQLLGLLLVEFDSKKDKFVLFKFSSIYCIFAGSLGTALHVYESMEFRTSIDAKFSAISFTIVVSIFNEAIMFFAMILTYQQQFLLRHKIKEMLNNFVLIHRSSKESSNEVFNYRINSCQSLFIMSVLTKIAVIIISLVAFNILIGKNFRILLVFLTFPTIVSTATCNQYFLGVLTTKYFLSTINERVQRLSEKLKFSIVFDENLMVQEELEKISVMHTKLYEFMNELTSCFGVQITLNIFSNFLNITVSAFQMFSTFLMLLFNYNDALDYGNFLAAGSLRLTAMCIDTVFHLKICGMFNDEVS
jgi:7tm Chemosensory receptor